MTACVVATEDTVAEKLAVVAPAATVTVPGTVTAALLLDRLTVVPPLAAAALSVTEQESVAGPTTELLAQVNELSVKTLDEPFPLKLTDLVP